MATDDGQMYFGIGLDLDGLNQSAENAKKTLTDIGNSASEQGGVIDNAFAKTAKDGIEDFSNSLSSAIASVESMRENIASIDSACDEQRDIIDKLSKEYNELAIALDKNVAEGSEEENNIRERMQAIKEECAERRTLISALQEQATAMEEQMVAAQEQINSFTQLNQVVEEHDNIIVRMLGGTENYKQIISLLPAPLQGVIKGIDGMSKAGLAFIATPLGATIGALVLALQALRTWFNSSAEGQMAFAKVSGYVSGVLGQLKEVVITVGRAIYNAFEDPQKAISDLAKAIRTNIENRFKAIGQLGQNVGQILKSAFSLDWEGVKKGVKDLTNSFLLFGTGVEDVTGKLSTALSHVHDTATETSKIAVETRQLEVEMSKYNEEAAKTRGTISQLRIIARDTTKSAEERNKALEEAKQLEKNLNDQELQFAKRQEDLIARRNALTTNSIEDENKLRDARAKTAQVEAQGYQAMEKYVRLQNSINRAGGGSATGSSGVTEELSAEEKAMAQAGDLLAKLVMDNTKKEISAMKDGHEKRMAELELERSEQLAEIERMEQQLQALNIQSGVQTTDKGLTSLQQEQIDRSRANVENAYKNGLNSILDNELADIRTYEQKRYDLEKEYAEKRNALYTTDENGNQTLRTGVSEGNVANLDKQYKEMSDALDRELLESQGNYEAWCNYISQLTLEQLEELLNRAQEALKESEENGTNEEDIALARAQVTKLSEEISKVSTSPNKSSTSEWTELYKTLQTCGKEFEKVGNTIGGTAGKIVSAVGQVSTSTISMLNSISQLTSKTEDSIKDLGTLGDTTVNVLSETADGMGEATKGAASATSAAISTVEKASVILTIISAALQVAMSIVNLFNHDNTYQKEIENLQRQIDQLQWELDNEGSVRIQNQLGDALSRVRDIYQETYNEVLRLHDANTRWGRVWLSTAEKIQIQNEILEKSIQKIADQYANLSYTADKAIGLDKYDEARKQLENYAEQLIYIQEQYDKENAKKKTDQDTLQDYQQQMNEIAEQMNDLLNELVEDIIGGTSEEISKQLGDAFVEAFQAGEDAAQAWADKVDDIVQDILKSLLVQQFIEPKIADIYDKYKEKWFPNGEWQGADAITGSMQDFTDELNAACGEFEEAWGAISDAMGYTSTSAREASARGIANASQESVDELNGRATAIQGHTYTINENTKLLVNTTSAILTSVMNIDSNTDGLSTRMERVEGYTRELRDTINDIQMKGVKIA